MTAHLGNGHFKCVWTKKNLFSHEFQIDSAIRFTTSHKVQGTGIFTYIDVKPKNQPNVGKHTVGPMDPSWE